MAKRSSGRGHDYIDDPGDRTNIRVKIAGYASAGKREKCLSGR
jgi:hypothetical protein